MLSKLIRPAIVLLAASIVGCNIDRPMENLAKFKTATASSNYDYNLTAQLLTDGIIETEEPSWLKVRTSEGEIAKREREWTLDYAPYSANVLQGEQNFIEYEWSRLRFTSGCVRIVGTVIYEQSKAREGWQVICLADGKEVGKEEGKGLPGRDYGSVRQSDPNKQEEMVTYPQRRFELLIPLENAKDFGGFRIEFSMPGAVRWAVNSVDFSETDGFGETHDMGPYYSAEARGMNMLPAEDFTSAWMSEGSDHESVTIDLGEKRNIRELRLHWIHRPAAVEIKVADEEGIWKDVETESEYEEGGDSLACLMKVYKIARYVSIAMDGPDASGHFALSEVEVLGPRSARVDSLQGPASWKLSRSSFVEASGEDVSKAGFDDSEWMPAVVPGTVLASFIEAGAVPDPAFSDNNNQISESYFNSDFWYRGVIQPEEAIDTSEGTPRYLLEFDGINWKAEVFLNGSRVGDIAGAFRREQFDVTDLVRPDSSNVVAVHVIKNANYGAVKDKNAETPGFNGGLLGADNPTFHASVGWDWIPTVRGREIGIWDDVRLRPVHDVALQNPLVQSHIENGFASVTASVEARNLSDSTLAGTLKGTIAGISFQKQVSIPAGETETITFTPEEFGQLENMKIALWWPNGYGEPTLHDASYSFLSKESQENGFGNAETVINYSAGIREFTYTDVMSDLVMYINGVRFFPKGGNWGFSEFNLRAGALGYDSFVRYHKDMNLNMIRNWVGQTGDKEFFEACDRYGIVVWQDFWLANPADGPDPADEDLFVDNAEDFVKKIRSHACIGLYCGRNEGYPPASLNSRLIATVERLHPGIVYIPSSADDGVSGHGPYRAVEPSFYFEYPTVKFHSERGMPAIMNIESLQRTFSQSHMWPTDDVWGQHDFTNTGAQGDTAFVGMVRRGFGEKALASENEFARYAQWINFEGYRAMYEANNVGQKGLLIWMSHSCWPSLAWQTYDYWMEPTAAYFGVKKACETVHVQLNQATEKVEVVNATDRDLHGLTVSLAVNGLDGSAIEVSEAEDISVQGFSTIPVLESGCPEGICFLTLKLMRKDGTVLSSNRYLRNYKGGKHVADYKELDALDDAELDCTQAIVGGKLVVRLRNISRNLPASLVRLNLVDAKGEQVLPVIYSDNYFTLLPGEVATVTVDCIDAIPDGAKVIVSQL